VRKNAGVSSIERTDLAGYCRKRLTSCGAGPLAPRSIP
jgi:hypothetical protein